MTRRALVTGAGGFVGANLCRRLMTDGHDVHAVVRPNSQSWRLDAIGDDLPIHRVELRDRATLSSTLQSLRPEWIFHLAAHGGYSWQTDIDAIFSTNTIATAHLVDLACVHGFEAFVHAGSSSEYGYKDHPPDEQEWIEPNSAYAVSKAAATHYARAVASDRNANIVTLRLYSAFGPWEEPNRLMPTLAMYGLQGRLPPLVDPRTARDFVFIEDVCEAFVLAASAGALGPGAVLNVGSGRQTTLRELVDGVRKQLQIEEEPRWQTMEPREWDTSVWVANCARLRSALGWEPTRDVADGFLALVDWLRTDESCRMRYAREIGLHG